MPDRLTSQIGLKLPADWRQRQAQKQLPGFEGDVYAYLRRLGLSYVELGTGACLEESEVELVCREATRLHQRGMALALHPYLGGEHNPAHFGQTEQPEQALQAVLGTAASAAEITGHVVVVNLHPAEARYAMGETDLAEYRRELLHRSNRFFRRARQVLSAHPGTVVVVEHQVPPHAAERIIRIGDTWRELLAAVQGTTLNVCLDTGHYLLAVRRHGQAPLPSAEFLHRVVYVHLHDVRGGRDHQPITEGSEGPYGLLHPLRQRGGSVAVTMEYEPDGIEAGGGVRPVLERSVRVLREWGIAQMPRGHKQ